MKSSEPSSIVSSRDVSEVGEIEETEVETDNVLLFYEKDGDLDEGIIKAEGRSSYTEVKR